MASSYQDRVKTMADNTKTVVAQLFSAFRAGQITADDLAHTLAELLGIAVSAAYELGVSSELAYMQLADGLATTAAAPAPAATVDREAFTKAVRTILEGDHDEASARLERLASVSVLDGGADGQHAALKADPERVAGWTRSLEADACELCVWWWREGRVWNSSTPMQRHKGCICEQAPVTALKQNKNVQSEQQAMDAEAKRNERKRRAI